MSYIKVAILIELDDAPVRAAHRSTQNKIRKWVAILIELDDAPVPGEVALLEKAISDLSQSLLSWMMHRCRSAR